MKKWVVAYKDKDFKGDTAIITAPNYTMAIVQFMVEYPECDYIAVLQLEPSESGISI